MIKKMTIARLYSKLLFLSIVVHISGLESPGKGLLDFIFSPCKCKCGIPNREARILGGEDLRGHEFPWLSLIQLKNKLSLSGSLINNRYVITSASNLIGLTPYDIKVTLGQFDRCFPDVSSTNVSVEKILIHPDFNPGNRAHDIALLKLANIINIDRRVSSICLTVPDKSYLGQTATLVGWPEDIHGNGTQNLSCRPRKLGLPVLGHSQCLNSHSEPEFVSIDKGCVGVVGVPSVICNVDSGGPVMHRSHNGVYSLIGVLTDKNECGGKPSTAIYTNLNQHLTWIVDNTRDACYCFKT